jgi:signal transduction histidine kinase
MLTIGPPIVHHAGPFPHEASVAASVGNGTAVDRDGTVQVTSLSNGLDGEAIQRLCHDIRQEIAVLQALVEILIAENDATDPGQRWLGRLQAQSLHVGEMLRSVVEGSSRADIDVSDFVAAVASDVQLRTGTAIGVEAAPARAKVDRILLRRAVVNLLDNALRAAGPSGSVNVRVRRHEREVLIEVEDTGPGFGRGDPGVWALGLGVVRDCAEQHGGALELTSGESGGALARLSISRPSGRGTESARW